MSYGKLAKGMSASEARRKLESVMPATDRSKDFHGSSPPAVFIGSHNYPKVNTGVLSPQFPGDSGKMDSPRDWYREGYGIERIASLRTSLINSKRRLKVEDNNSFLDNTQEIAMARKPVDIEVSLKKQPRGATGGRVKPVSASGDVEKFLLGENPSVNRRVEKAFYDTDLKAETAVEELYTKDVDSYRIQNSFSAGLLGEDESRKLVPTRWSITATDDIVSRKLRERVKDYQQLGQIEHYKNSYLGNNFHIFLIPGKWEYELIEMKEPGSVWNAAKNTHIGHDYESFNGRKRYAEETAGAFYATRLGIAEHLEERKRQAKAIVLREVTPDYWAPLGVWVIRETVRNAFEEPEELDSFKQVEWTIAKEFRFLYHRIKNRSRMMNARQSSLDSFSSQGG